MNAENFDWNNAIPAITLIVAIVSPIMVAIMNNIHNTKIRKLELKYKKQTSYFQKQQSVFDNYILYASKQIDTNYQSEHIEYIRYYGEMFMYVPEYHWGELETLHKYIQNKDKKNANQQLIKVTKILGLVLRESDLRFPKL